MKELENASAKYHISYLEVMKLQVQQHAELLSTIFEKGITEFLGKSYEDFFYHVAYEIAKGTSIGSNLAKLDTKKINTVIQKPWAQDGKVFSDRIWANKERLVQKLHTELTQSVIRGTPPMRVIDTMSRMMDVSKSQAGRLIMTESAAIASRAQQDCFRELGVERYEIVATLDSKTSEICQEMDGKVFDQKDYEVGVTAPPFHPWCRTTTAPYFDDEFTEGEQRTARDEKTGKMVYVPADMTYKEWRKKFIEKTSESDTIKPENTKEVADVHLVGKINREIYSCVAKDIVTDEVIITDNQIQHIKDRHPNDYERFSEYFGEIVANPDFIIESPKPNTALILKEIITKQEQFKTVLRLVASGDNPQYKNSIITFMKIDEKEWSRLLRNKKILYKKE